MNLSLPLHRQLSLLPVRITLIFAAIFLGAAAYLYFTIFSFLEEDLTNLASQEAMLRLEQATASLDRPALSPALADLLSSANEIYADDAEAVAELVQPLQAYSQVLFPRLAGDDVALYTLVGDYVTSSDPHKFPPTLDVGAGVRLITAPSDGVAHSQGMPHYGLLPLFAATDEDGSASLQIAWQVIYIDTSARLQLQDAFALRMSLGFVVTAGLILAGGTYLRSYTQRSLQPLLQLTQEIGQEKWHEPFNANLTGEFRELSLRILEMRANLAQYQQQRQTIVARVSHDIVGPLKTVMLVAESNRADLAESDTSSHASQDHAAHDWQLVQSCAEHVNRLLEDLYYLINSKINYQVDYQVDYQVERHLPSLELEPVLRETLLYYASRYRRRQVAFQVDAGLEPTAYRVRIERTRFLQIVGNLVENAITHGQATHIVFQLSLEQEDDTPGGDRATDKTKRVRIDVTDNGTGIDEDVVSHIFTERFTTSNAVSPARRRMQSAEKREFIPMTNRGLGLAIVADIVRAHGGEITVLSTGAQGTVFTILFPAGGQAGHPAANDWGDSLLAGEPQAAAPRDGLMTGTQEA